VVFEHVIPPKQTSLRSTDQGIQQSLPFQDQPAEKSVSARVRSVKHDGKRYLQDLLWQESLLAVKVSLECQTVAELTTRLQEKLPQNSALTRRRKPTLSSGVFSRLMTSTNSPGKCSEQTMTRRCWAWPCTLLHRV
jgi:hypothetical protein